MPTNLPREEGEAKPSGRPFSSSQNTFLLVAWPSSSTLKARKWRGRRCRDLRTNPRRGAFFVRRKGKPVGLTEIGDHRVEFSACRIEPIDVAGRLLRFGTIALLVRLDTVSGIGEPHAAIASDDVVVRRIQAFALKTVGQNGYRAIDLGAGDVSAGRTRPSYSSPGTPYEGAAKGFTARVT